MKLSILKKLIKEEINRTINEIKVGGGSSLFIDPKMEKVWKSDKYLKYSLQSALDTLEDLKANGLEEGYRAYIVSVDSIDWLWAQFTASGMMIDPKTATLLFKKNGEQISIDEDGSAYVLNTNVPAIANLPEFEDHAHADDAAQIINAWYANKIE
jgi:putative NADH-flavin reductase